MSNSDTDAKLERLIASDDTYAPRRGLREWMALTFGVGMASGALAIAIHATIEGHWDSATFALLTGTVLASVFSLVTPWTRLPREYQLTLYWLAVVAITAAVYVLDAPSIALTLLLPMIGLTYFFGHDRRLVGGNLLLAMAAYALPVITGDAGDPAGRLMITLPAIVTVALLSGALSERFHTMRARERTRYKATIEALTTALTARDGYTGEHSHETLWFVRAVCDELKLRPEDCEYISDVALLHDIGKIGIPNEVLHEPGKLSDEQWEIMKQHPVIGEKIVATVPGMEAVARAIRHEHEHWDGSGYPDGLSQGEIPLASRIVLVCDAFHAMTSDRPYRAAMTVAETRLELSRCAGTQFDPTVVGALLQVLDSRGHEFSAHVEQLGQVATVPAASTVPAPLLAQAT
ncbi:MAG: HD-GYP domain-containing protein [Actinobacteria bacterium]|nr:HD-GYP domain-containing protein [Actinomycetota bacterium]